MSNPESQRPSNGEPNFQQMDSTLPINSNTYLQDLLIERRQPNEIILPEIFERVTTGIPEGRIALLVVFLLRHPNGLHSHPDGIRAEELRTGLAEMMGVPTEAMDQIFGPHRSFVKFLKEIPHSIVAVHDIEGRTQYDIPETVRAEALEFSEIMLSHSQRHRVPFDAFLPRDITTGKRNTLLPLRLQIARALETRFQSGQKSVEPMEVATDVGTDPKSMAKAVIYHMRLLRGLGIEYRGLKPGEARSYMDVSSLSDTQPLLSKSIYRADVIFQAMTNLKSRGIPITNAELFSELELLDPYFQTINRNNFFNKKLPLLLTEWNIPLLTVDTGARRSSTTDFSDFVTAITYYENQDVEKLGQLTQDITRLTDTSPEAKELAKNLWLQSRNFDQKILEEVPEQPIRLVSKQSEQETSFSSQSNEQVAVETPKEIDKISPSTDKPLSQDDTSNEVQLRTSPESLPLSEVALSREALHILFTQLNTTRKVFIAEILLENKESYPNGMTPLEIRRALSEKFGFKRKRDASEFFGSYQKIYLMCMSLAGDVIQVNDDGQKRITIRPEMLEQTQAYVETVLEFNASHQNYFETFLPRHPQESKGIKGLPLRAELAHMIVRKLLHNGLTTNNLLTKKEITDTFPNPTDDIDKILRNYTERNLCGYEELHKNQSHYYYRLTETAPDTYAFPSDVLTDIYVILKQERDEDPLQLHSRSAIIQKLRRQFPEKYGSQSSRNSEATFRRYIDLLLEPSRAPQELIYSYEVIPHVRITPHNDFESIGDFVDILMHAESGEKYGHPAQTRFQNGFVSAFRVGTRRNTFQRAREIWENSIALDKRVVHTDLSQMSNEIFAAMSRFPKQMVKTQEIIPFIERSPDQVLHILKNLRNRWKIIGIKDKGEYIWKLPDKTEQMQLKYLQTLSDGGVVRIEGSGRNLSVKVIPSDTVEYEGIMKGFEHAVIDHEGPVVLRQRKNVREMFIKARSLTFSINARTGKINGSNYDKYMELISLMEFARLAEYTKLIRIDDSLPSQPPFTVMQLAEWLAQSGDNPIDAVHSVETMRKSLISTERLQVLSITEQILSWKRRTPHKKRYIGENTSTIGELQEVQQEELPVNPSVELPEVEQTALPEVLFPAPVSEEAHQETPMPIHIGIAQGEQYRYSDAELLKVARESIENQKSYRDLDRNQKEQLWFKYRHPRNDEMRKQYEETIYLLNIRLVYMQSKGYRGLGLPDEDLIQEGSIGLLTAIQKYDIDRAEFSTHAAFWIRQALSRAIFKTGRAIRIPEYKLEQLMDYNTKKNRLQNELGVEPALDVLMESLNLSEEAVLENEALLQLNNIRSLDQPLEGDEDTSSTLYDVAANEHLSGDFAEELIESVSLSEEAEMFLAKIKDPRIKAVIKYRFGLEDGKEWTLEEIGKEFGVSRERVRQLEEKGLAILRSHDEDE